jgi:hypothetical protein
VIFVDRWFPSSKTCSCCGTIKHDLKLSDREYICENCGLVIDRDENAAINIEVEGIRLYNELMEKSKISQVKHIGQRMSELTLVNNPLMDDKEAILLRSNDWLKQENMNLHNFS